MEPLVTPSEHHASLDALGRALSAAIADPDAATLARQRDRFLAVAPTPAASRRRPRAVAAGLSLAAAAALALLVSRDAPLTARAGAQPVRAGSWVAAGATPLELRFSDGSRVVLAAGAHARLESLDARGARVLIERGAVEASVHHAARTAWRFAAGPYTVDVMGTGFSMGWEPARGRFDLAMRDGRVTLRGPRCADGLAVRDRDEVHADTLAQTLTVGPLARDVAALAPPPRAPVAAGPTPQLPIPVEAPASAPPRARRAARADDRAAHAPTPALDDAVDDAAGLLRQADALRGGGQGMRAREVLLAVRSRYAGSPEASRAAFVLGVLSLDTFRAPAEASRWFELCLREAPDGPLSHEARGRRVQALHAAGDADGAREAAARYLARDPDGPFAPFARGILPR